MEADAKARVHLNVPHLQLIDENNQVIQVGVARFESNGNFAVVVSELDLR